MCGCGDGLLSEGDVSGARTTARAGSEWFSGFRGKGTFEQIDIIAVHKATSEDPTCLGEHGTYTLRNSKDPYNAALTFTVIYRSRILGQVVGVDTLDIESSSEDDYFLLSRGFEMLKRDRERAVEHKSECSASAVTNEVMGRAEQLWRNGANGLISSQRKSRRSVNPASRLFETPSFTDPWRLANMGLRTPRVPTGSNYSLPPSRFLGWNAAGTQIWARYSGTIIHWIPIDKVMPG